jgi:hypothetical protein
MLSLVKLFITEDLLDCVCDQTNLHGVQSSTLHLTTAVEADFRT